MRFLHVPKSMDRTLKFRHSNSLSIRMDFFGELHSALSALLATSIFTTFIKIDKH